MEDDISADEARRFGHELAGKIVDMIIASEEHPKSVGFAFAGALASFMCALASEHDVRLELFDAWAALTRGKIEVAPRDPRQAQDEATGQTH
jgi:hypothetical protein